MKELNPAKVAIICILFLAVLYLSSALDFAIAAVIISSSILFTFPSLWLFVAAFIFFSLHIIFRLTGLQPDFIGDLTVSSYALFAAGLVFYFKEGQKNIWRLDLPLIRKINISRYDMLKLGGILLFVFLIYPLIDVYLAAITGYIGFSIVFRKNEGRFAFAVALFFLTLCPFLLIAKNDKVAETAAIFTYYFLVVGVIQEIIDIIRNPKEDKEMIPLRTPEKILRLRSERLKGRKTHLDNSSNNKDRFIKIKI